MTKILIGFAVLLVSSVSSAICTPDGTQPTGYRAEKEFSPAIANVQLTCAIQMDLVENQQVPGSFVHRLTREFPKNPKANRYSIEFRRNPEGQFPKWAAQTFREPAVIKPTQLGVENAIPTLSSWNINLDSNAISTDPTDRSRLVQIFDYNKNENGSFFEQRISPLYAQQIVSCDKNGKEVAQLQLVSLLLQNNLSQNRDPKIFRQGQRIEKPESVISTTTTGIQANSTAQLILPVKNRENTLTTVSCRSTPQPAASEPANPEGVSN